MKKISSYADNKMMLVQPSVLKREFILKSSEEALGTLDYPKFFSNDAVTEILGEKYEIRQPSIWRSEVLLYKPGYSYSFAKYSANFWRTTGILDLPRGTKLNFKFGVFKKACEISTTSGEPMVLFKNTFSFKEKSNIEIKKQSELLDENPWIIILGWYLLLQHRRSAAAAG